MKSSKVKNKSKHWDREKLLKGSKTNILLSLIYTFGLILVAITAILYALSFFIDSFLKDNLDENGLLLGIVICIIVAIIIIGTTIKNCDSLIGGMKKSKFPNSLIEEIAEYRDNFGIPILSLTKAVKLRKNLINGAKTS